MPGRYKRSLLGKALYLGRGLKLDVSQIALGSQSISGQKIFVLTPVWTLYLGIEASGFSDRVNSMRFTRSLLIPLLWAPLVFADVPLGTREILLDNDQVEVVRLTYPVGSESGMHTHQHPNRVVYFVKGGKVELVPADQDSSVSILTVEDGKTLFLPGTTHNVRNIGDTEVVIVETELKHD
jgi:mannose-6-phosphate isomerase-like protein (cupin superfamily)